MPVTWGCLREGLQSAGRCTAHSQQAVRLRKRSAAALQDTSCLHMVEHPMPRATIAATYLKQAPAACFKVDGLYVSLNFSFTGAWQVPCTVRSTTT